jgi:hypothetical protein
MKNRLPWLTAAVLVLSATALGAQAAAAPRSARERAGLVGAWRAHISFTDGAFAQMKDLEFSYVYNAGGTLTESSNYDAAPPVPPAYGIWRKTGARTFQSKYVFYVTKSPASFDDIKKGGGWAPDGHGVFTETITLSEDGKSYTATIAYVAFGEDGKPAAGGGTGTATGTRLEF